MVSVPILAMPDFSKTSMIEMNASSFGLGTVLLQEYHPMAFFIHTLGLQAHLKSMYRKELMAIIFAIANGIHTFSEEGS